MSEDGQAPVPGAPASGTLGRVGVVGLGLIGGSLVRALHGRGEDVVGWDLDAATREAARAAGLTVVDDVLATAAVDLLVLAVPMRAMARTAAVLAPAVGPATTVTDVGSVKAPVRAALRAAGLGDRYVGAHPMAGTEEVGFTASSATLLTGATWAVTVPSSGAGPDEGPHVDRVLALVAAAGGVPLRIEDETHDQATALVSHVPHVAATGLLATLVDSPVREVALRLAAGSFRDGTRVARTDARRTQAMVEANAAQVAPVLRALAASLVSVADDLDAQRPTDWYFDAPDPVREELDGR